MNCTNIMHILFTLHLFISALAGFCTVLACLVARHGWIDTLSFSICTTEFELGDFLATLLLYCLVILCLNDPFCAGQREGESCGSCFCPPTFTAGECEEGLTCVRDPMIPDLPGKCTKTGNINISKTIGSLHTTLCS